MGRRFPQFPLDDLIVSVLNESTGEVAHSRQYRPGEPHATTAGISGRSYNVGTGESVTIRRLAELVWDTVGSDSEIVHTGARNGDINQSVADVSRIRRGLAYGPAIDLNDGLAALVES